MRTRQERQHAQSFMIRCWPLRALIWQDVAVTCLVCLLGVLDCATLQLLLVSSLEAVLMFQFILSTWSAIAYSRAQGQTCTL
jgi:hypothetical protein